MVKKKTNKKGGKDDWDDSIDAEVPTLKDQEEDESDFGKPSASVFALLGDDDEDGGGLMGAISKSKKKKDKKKQAKIEFSDDDKPSLLDNLPLSDEEFDDVFSQPAKTKKNKKKTTVLSFDALDELSDAEDVPKPSKKDKKKKKDNLPAFDALEDEETGEVPGPVTTSKKDKKKKDKLPAFDALEDEEELAEPIEILEYTPPAPKGKVKKNNKKKDDDLDVLAALIEDDTVVVEPASNSKGKKNKKGKKANQDELDALAALIEDDSVVPEPSPSKSPKNKKGNKTIEAEVPDEVEDSGEIKIKSAKQKEKERKERQKEEKKRQAALQKQKEEAEAEADKAPEVVSEASTTATPEPAAKGKKGKKGPGGAIAALKKQLEAQRAAEAELLRLQQEEEARVAAEEKRLAEEERIKAEAIEAKRKADAEKKEQLRKEGKLLTKAQKEAKKKAELRLQSMIATGAIVAGLKDDNESKEDAKPKRVIYSSKKKKHPNPSPKLEEVKPVPVAEPKVEAKLVETSAKKEEDDDEDWENKSFDDVAPSPTVDDVKDSWDQSSDEEKEEPASVAEVKESAPVKSEPKPSTQNNTKKTEPEEESEEDDSDEDDSEEDSDDDDDSDDDSSEEELSNAQKMALQKKMESAERRKKRLQQAMASRSKDDLRSPICCILGHVDTGKTKLLDKIRQTNVQEGEAGGITQQIGATYFPVENIIQKTAVLGKDGASDYKLPGLLVIDTPGHESFTNLRSRGSSLCNIAILVVDIMHGLEPQTLESLRLLRDKKTPFIVALNKIDRIYGWKATPDNGFQQSLKLQPKHVIEEFETRVTNTITAFAEQGLNAKLYYENKNFAKYVSFVPTSAITGEGIPDILDLLVTLTQTRLSERLMYVSELECTVLEVKVIEGLGTTIDVVLSNGYLNEGDRIVVCGLNGPIVTQVRALLTPQPLRELRIKSQYVHHKRVKAALGIKISAPDLEKAIAGSRLMVVGPDDDEDDIKDAVMEDLETLLKSIDTSGRGVCVQASTLGSLEALLEFLRTSKIPVSGINIGPVHKKDIVRTSAMLEKAKEYAVLLAFDVEVDREAQSLAESMGVKIFTADIIYHLFDQFTAYNKLMIENKRKEQAPMAIFPCVLKMVPGAIFNKRDPIVIGANVVEGTLRLGTPVCVINVDPATKKRDIVTLGTVSGIELNHKPMEMVKKGADGAGVAVKIDAPLNEAPRLYGRHFFDTNEIYSKITRNSINVLKESFREDLSKEEWGLVVKLKKILDVV